MCHVQAAALCVFTQASGGSGLGTRLVSTQDMTSEGALAVHVYSHLSSRIVATVRDPCVAHCVRCNVLALAACVSLRLTAQCPAFH